MLKPCEGVVRAANLCLRRTYAEYSSSETGLRIFQTKQKFRILQYN